MESIAQRKTVHQSSKNHVKKTTTILCHFHTKIPFYSLSGDKGKNGFGMLFFLYISGVQNCMAIPNQPA